MPFVQFVRQNGTKKHKIEKPPISRVDKHARVTFPLAVQKRFVGRKFVTLFYNQEDKVIGVKPLKKYRKDASYTVFSPYKTAGQPVYAISLGSFLKHFKIEGAEQNGFLTKWNGATKMIEINLENAIPLQVRGTAHATSGKREKTLLQGD
jgi:hypothetical protein